MLHSHVSYQCIVSPLQMYFSCLLCEKIRLCKDFSFATGSMLNTLGRGRRRDTAGGRGLSCWCCYACSVFLLLFLRCQRLLRWRHAVALAFIKFQWYACWRIPGEACRHPSRQQPCLSPPALWPGVSFPGPLPTLFCFRFSTSLGFKSVDPLWPRSTSLPSSSHLRP